jgi:transmembrane sensor
MEKRDAKELLKKYHAGNCTEEEKALLESWYLDWQGGEFDLSDEDLESIKDQTFAQVVKYRHNKNRFSYWRRYVAAAVIVFAVLSAGVLIYNNNRTASSLSNQHAIQPVKNDAVPGGNKALLTLADGTIVQLDDVGTGRIVEIAGMTIRKTSDGEVVYEVAPSGVNKEEAERSYNQISTPRGGQYKIILPDGTKVWLNAASSLKYPVQFDKNARHVELAGEGYFEVSKQHLANGDHTPFFVSTATQTVEVLGTHFNINSYGDEEAVLTTLLEGAVKVSHSSQKGQTVETILKPGQQAALIAKSFNVKKIDTEEAVAWKNGYFSFERADLSTVMRQLSRWYDVDVVYAGEVPSETFTGKVYRNMSLSKVLDILSYTQVNFKMEGKKLIITP